MRERARGFSFEAPSPKLEGVPKPIKALTPKEELFCQEYLKDLNATRAAERAGYRGTAEVLKVTASRLLTKANVAARVQDLMDARKVRVEVRQDEVLREILRLANADLRKLFDEKGQLKPMDEWPDDTAAAVASVEVDEIWWGRGADRQKIGETKKLKLWNKGHALELLGRHLKLFTDTVKLIPPRPEEQFEGYTKEELKAMREIQSRALARRSEDP